MLEQQSPIPPTQRPLFEANVLETLKTERQQWEETTVQPSKQRMPEREYLMTTSGVPIKRIYTPQDNAAVDYRRDLNLPGEYPYTRGVQPTMYRAKPWTMRMFAGFGTAEDTNTRFNSNAVWGPLALDTDSYPHLTK